MRSEAWVAPAGPLAQHAADPVPPQADVARAGRSRHKGNVPNERRTAKEIFTAYQREPPKRPLPVWTIAFVLFAIGMYFASKSEKRSYRVVTERGIKAVSPGMPQSEFVQLLGNPIAREPGAEDCYRYGRLTLEKPTFVLYTACFDGGKLRDVIPKTYTSASVAP